MIRVIMLSFFPLVSCFFSSRQLQGQSRSDLVVLDISLVPVPESGRIYTGSTIQVPMKVTIANQGTASIVCSNTRQYTISVELQVAGRRFHGYVKGLAAGASADIYLKTELPITYSGRRTQFTAVVDPCNKNDDVLPCPVGNYEELNENNNSRTSYLSIPTYRKIVIKSPSYLAFQLPLWQYRTKHKPG